MPAAFLVAQLEELKKITDKRLSLWKAYRGRLAPICETKNILLPKFSKHSNHNAHIFYLILNSENQRNDLAAYLKTNGIIGVSHYVPLHSAPAGKKFGTVCGDMTKTNSLANRLLRLPMYYDLSIDDVSFVCSKVEQFLDIR